MVNPVYEKLLMCYNSYKERIHFKPEAALILGSGLGDYAETVHIEATLNYHDIEGFPQSTVEGHKGRFVFGYIDKVPVVIMQGRVHYYEGYSMQDVVLPIRLMKMMGAKILFLTNAAGSVNLDYNAGDFMMITDQIACLVPSPLIGANIDELGLRFSDMSKIYDKNLCSIIRKAADDLKIPIREGVYIQFSGPNYESPAEIRMARILGADAAGMSTACEAIAANHMGMKVCGISCISNLGSGISKEALSHMDVSETANRVAPLFKQLITASIKEMATIL